ncbi:hypothetical protein D3C81_1031900 [compost metagenome]
MLLAGMVNHQVHNYLDISLMRFLNERVKVGQRSEVWVDSSIVCHIIAMIAWGRVDRREPDSSDTKILQIIKLCRNSFQVTDSISISIRVRTDKYFIING